MTNVKPDGVSRIVVNVVQLGRQSESRWCNARNVFTMHRFQGYLGSAIGHLDSGVDEAAKCDDSLKALILWDSLPDIACIGVAAWRKPYIPHIAVKTLVKRCGPEFLERCLGRMRARELMARYAEGEVLSGL